MDAVGVLKREFSKNSKDVVTFIKPTGITTGRVKATAKKSFSILCSIQGIFAPKKNNADRNVGEIQGYEYTFYCLKENWNIGIDQTCRVVLGSVSDISTVSDKDHWLIDTIELRELLQFSYGVYAVGVRKWD